LTEHYAGAFPAWIAPVQAVILPISDKFNVYAEDINRKLQDLGVRSELDNRKESLGKKIRESELKKIPAMIIIGQKEVEKNEIAVRFLKEGDKGHIDLAKLAKQLNEIG
jgi:threonyl-tRNA synthetase